MDMLMTDNRGRSFESRAEMFVCVYLRCVFLCRQRYGDEMISFRAVKDLSRQNYFRIGLD
jgi:hypothetical protein